MRTIEYDEVEFLTDEETISEYLKICLEERPEYLSEVENEIAKARIINNLAQIIGISRDVVYKTFRNNKMSNSNVLRKIFDAFTVDKLTKV
ncbi:MAG: hypothetical protein LBT85_03005 [Bifidobacteriaceae bacterium]|jgi:probable addiction module antidote protein|nr:hypothetical protein [Bifidobacteriaceae bacterium]